MRMSISSSSSPLRNRQSTAGGIAKRSAALLFSGKMPARRRNLPAPSAWACHPVGLSLACLCSVAPLLLLSASGCAPRALPPVSQLVQELSGEKKTRLRRPAQLETAYAAVLEKLLPEMGAESIGEREQAQQDFERICFYAGRPGAEKERCALCTAMLPHLGCATPLPARVWLLRQLERLGDAESVTTLARLLRDENPGIRELARRALQQNPSATAGYALRSALYRTQDPAWQIALANALAARRSPEGTLFLSSLAQAPQPEVAAAAIAALSEVESPLAWKPLYRALQGSDESLRGAAAGALLRKAERETERGDAANAAQVFQEVYAAVPSASWRLAALRGYALAAPNDALLLLRRILREELDGDLNPAAVRIAQEISGPTATKMLAEVLEETISASHPAAGTTRARELTNAEREVRVQMQVVLIDALSQREAEHARPAVMATLVSPEPEVRCAFLRALRRQGVPEDAVFLAQIAANAYGDEGKTARSTLDALPGVQADKVMLRALRMEEQGEVRAELVRSLGARRSSLTEQAVELALSDEEAQVRAAGYRVAGLNGTSERVPALVAALLREQDEDARRTAEDALVLLCQRRPDDARRAEEIQRALERADGALRCSLLRILARLQCEGSLAALRGSLSNTDEQVADTAVRLLANWDGVEALDDLVQVARLNDNPKRRAVALRGYVRIVRLPSERAPARTLRLLKIALSLAEQPAERKLVLGALGDVICLESLKLTAAYLDDAELKLEAAASLLRIAQPLSAAHYDESVAAVNDVLKLEAGESQKLQARTALEVIESGRGYLSNWLAAGPYTREGVKAADLLATTFPPEQQDPAEIAWQPLPVTDPKDPWTIDLAQAFGGSNRCVYVTAEAWVDTETPVRIELGSDDGVKVWLNDTVVHENNAARGLTRAEDKLDAVLNPGWNRLLLKIAQGSGEWGFTCGIKTPAGGNVEGMRFRP